MKKNDVISIIIILILIGVGFVSFSFFSKKDGNLVKVTVDGKHIGSYSLGEEQEISIRGTNIIKIANGEVQMIEANCPDQICVSHRAISKNQEKIICLPNKVIIETVHTQ